MDNSELISTLNNLIETSKDGEAGFRTCAEDISDDRLKALFATRSQECAKAALELQEQVRSLGGDPEKSTSISADMHRRWIDIKAAVVGKDDVSILNECERGEDVAKKSYRNALEKDLPASIRAIVERQNAGVLRNHDQVKALRDQARETKEIAG
ncbi:MAG: PA2169 family four-helix-bundle protein [Janthinobacterium lividum]